jgi:PAS domain-containing protein
MDIREFHWLANIIQALDVGLVVIDLENRVQIWNGFMESHSGKLSSEVKDRDLYDIYPTLDQAWLDRKLTMVRTLNTRAFISWEQRPFLFRFSNYRPITGSAEFMYQNVTIMPLPDFTGNVQHIGLLIYDVTDEALGRQMQSNHLSDAPQSID